MTNGVRLGGAYFELDASSAGLIQALKQAEDASKKSVSQISQATGVAEKDVQRLAQTWLRAEKTRADASAAATLRIVKGYNDQAEAATKAARLQAEASKGAAGGFGDLLKASVGLGAGLAGVTLGVEGARKALEEITKVTQEARQAQFELAATYKGTSGAFTGFVGQQAEALKKTRAEIEQSISAFGSLSNRYAIDGDQIKELTKRSADLAAVKGITSVEASKRLEAALRGEAESAEYLGLTLNSDYLKKFADMTDFQRKNFETLDPLTKAQITYREALKQTDAVAGAAVQRTKEQAGAVDNLKTSSSNLALVLGKAFSPGLADLENSLAKGLQAIADFYAEVDMKQAQRRQAIEAQPNYRGSRAFYPAGTGQPGGPGLPIADTREADLGRHESDDVAAAAKKRRDEDARAAADRRNQISAALQDADKANDATAASAIAAIDKEKKAKEQWYGEEKQRIEARKVYQLEDIATRKDAALQAIRDQQQATKDADDLAIRDAERRKDVELRGITEAHDQALAAVKGRADELKTEREHEDRDVKARREQADRDLADSRERAERQVSDAREGQDRDAEADHQKVLRRVEYEHTAAARALDDEADRDRRKSDQAVRNLERQSQREDERHRKALANIDAESKRQLDAIDVQIRALDDAQHQDDNASRVNDLQGKVSEAQAALAKAQGTGTPDQVAGARGDLTQAIRGGNEISIANARERLGQLAGQGADAVKNAQTDLTKALADLQAEQTKEVRDSQKQQLEDQKATIKAVADAAKDDENERNRRRKSRLDSDKQAASDTLKNQLSAIDKRKQSESDAHDEHVRIVASDYQVSKQRLQDSRQDEDRRLQDSRQAQDRKLAADRDAEDAALKDARSAEDQFLAQQTEAIGKAQQEQRQDLEEHYNGPNGVVTQLRAASVEHDREYSHQLATTTAAFEAERKAAERVYTNPEGTGQLDLLDKARTDETTKLEASKTEWGEWSKAASAAIKAATSDLDEFIKHGANIPRLGGDRAAQAHGPIGTLTSTSDEETLSTTTGRKVRGDVSSWLNDAIDLTGVSNDWIVGLQKLVSLESGGDPHILNREGSGASGLLQVKPDTFKAYRDKSLPDDIFDPVANAVASIRYILDTYGDVKNIPGVLDGRTFPGYAQGGVIDRDSWLVDRKTGARWGTIAEGNRPELITPMSRMAAVDSLAPMRDYRAAGRFSTLQLPEVARTDYAAVGLQMASAFAGRESGHVDQSTHISVSGVGMGEVATEIGRQQQRSRLLRGGQRWR